ncbi:helix-turn-helix domain-containing protein [Dysgonomonas sp. 520]|uniref:helix-turn-helix domain-containing protein n=1 Tax=Dysgonomonas sp. 520 TaxID=2302931 RepID=UPI0013D4F5D4|nr:helix-turn-helix domain-containing protein [Dysgonomonas sp. 520]NDW08860.1 AraC family transcriptional regulator [Dysgonomonas sp. 520]
MMNFTDNGIVEAIALDRGKLYTTDKDNSKIVLVTKGSIEFSFSMYNNVEMDCGKMLFVPSGYGFRAMAMEDAAVIFFNITEEYDWCRAIAVGNNQLSQDVDDGISFLDVKDMLGSYVYSIELYLQKGYRDCNLMQLKIKELGCIMNVCYTKQELHDFFRLYQTNDLLFSEQVRKYSAEIRTVRQLSERMNYSYSGFNKRFRRVFGMSAYKWMKQQRARIVYHEIYETNKSLKQISADNKFMTLSHFNEFCHKVLGGSPRQIRKQRYMEQSS